MTRVQLDEDEGSILPLTIFYGTLALVMVMLVVSASSLYLERKRLFTVADGAALVGAEAFELDEVTATSDGSVGVELDSGRVRNAVELYLAENPMNDFDSLRVVRADSVDGRSATVVLRSNWRPPVVSILVPEGVPVEVTAVARSVFD